MPKVSGRSASERSCLLREEWMSLMAGEGVSKRAAETKGYIYKDLPMGRL